MLNHEVGPLLARLRKQRGWTQMELAEFSSIDQTTISKIESGKATPHKATLQELFEVMGLDANKIPSLLTTPQDARWEKAKNDINAAIIKNDYDEAKKLLNAAESNEEYMRPIRNKQFVMISRIQIILSSLVLHGKEMDDAINTQIIHDLYTGIKLNIPKFELDKVEQYYYDSTTVGMLHLLADAYITKACDYKVIDVPILTGESYENGLSIFRGLVKYLEEQCLDSIFKEDALGQLSMLLINTLSLGGHYEEALALCEKHIERERSGRNMRALPNLLREKANCLINLNRNDEAKEPLRLAYYGHKILNYPEHFLNTLVDEAKEIGLTLET